MQMKRSVVVALTVLAVTAGVAPAQAMASQQSDRNTAAPQIGQNKTSADTAPEAQFGGGAISIDRALPGKWNSTKLPAPTIASPKAGEATGARPTVTGTGKPRSTVTVHLTDANGKDGEYQTVVNNAGNWKVLLRADLPAGKTRIQAWQTHSWTSSPITEHEFTVKGEDAKVPAPTITTPKVGEATEVRPIVTGKGEPGATVNVKFWDPVAGKTLLTQQTIVDANGNWSITANTDLPTGPTIIEASQEVSGVTGPTSKRGFEVKPGGSEKPDEPKNQKVDPRKMTELVLADYDGDGNGDILAKPSPDSGYYFFKGDGKGNYALGKKIFDTWNHTQTVGGDFDGDGHRDIVAVDSDAKLRLWRGNGDGTFGPEELVTDWTGKEQTTAGDINGDGVDDLIARDGKDNKLKAWKGKKAKTIKTGDIAAPNLFAPAKILTPWNGFTQTTISDVDGDGYADLIAAIKDETGQTVLKFWKSEGDVAGNPFQKSKFLTQWANFDETTAGDYNHDGKSDLLAIDGNKGLLKSWASNGDTTRNPFEKPHVITLEIQK